MEMFIFSPACQIQYATSAVGIDCPSITKSRIFFVTVEYISVACAGIF